MNYSDAIKQRIIKNILGDPHIGSNMYEQFPSAIIFKNLEDNFLPSSYQSIQQNPQWKARTLKVHSKLNDGTLEMQSSNSSDALLMNIFCNPGVRKWIGISKLLHIDTLSEIEFGWNPSFENEKIVHPTEIDMKIGNRIFEAKLTEESFTEKEKEIVENYPNFHTVFNPEYLESSDKKYHHYQLIRNILTAYKYNFSFSILVDETRTDLIRALFSVVQAIREPTVRNRVSFFTWQEIADACGAELKNFLQQKYL
jgi:hypothetical protein